MNKNKISKPAEMIAGLGITLTTYIYLTFLDSIEAQVLPSDEVALMLVCLGGAFITLSLIMTIAETRNLPADHRIFAVVAIVATVFVYGYGSGWAQLDNFVPLIFTTTIVLYWVYHASKMFWVMFFELFLGGELFAHKNIYVLGHNSLLVIFMISLIKFI